MTEDRKKRDITFILKDLLKVIKVVSLYPANNPLPTSLRRSFAEKLESVIDDHGDLSFVIEADNISFENEVVFENKSAEDNLAAIFYDAGITEMKMMTGLDVEEIYKFLDTMKAYMNSSDKSLDLVTLLWESNISLIKFRTLEDIALSDYDENFNLQEFMSAQSISKHASGSSIAFDESEDYQQIFLNDSDERVEHNELVDLDDAPQPPKGTSVNKGNATFYASRPESQTSSVLADNEEDEISFKVAEAASAMGLDNLPQAQQAVPDTAILLNDSFRLSEEEEKKITELLQEDAAFEPFESTVALLKEMLHQESEMNAFYETVTICEKIMSEFISKGKIAEAGQILKYLIHLQKKTENKKPLWSERLKDALITAGSKERLKVLATALNEYPDIAEIEINSYLSNFNWTALSNITDLIGMVEDEKHRNSLVEYLSKNGKENVDVVGKGIFDKKPEVVCNSISILARIGDKKSMTYLSKVTEHKEDVVRLQLVNALKETPNDAALDILIRSAFDNIKQIRRASVESIIAREGRPAFDAIKQIITNDEFNNQDPEDQTALLKAYSKLGGEEAVGFLVRLAKTANILHDSRLTFFRKAAFEALSINRSEKCERELLRLTRSLRPNLKKLARQTLQQRREIIYGGETV